MIILVLILAIGGGAYYGVAKTKKMATIKQNDTAIGQYTDTNPANNTATTTLSSIPTTTSPVPTSAVVVAPTCSLQLTLQPNVSSVNNGDQILYNVTIKNNSVQPCPSTSLSLYYSDNETFVSSSLKPSASNYYWNFGIVEALGQRNFTITTKANQTSSSNIHTDSCVSASGAADVCSSSDIIISGVYTPIATTPTTPPPSQQPSTTSSTNSIPVYQVNASKEYGVWVWVSPMQMSQDYLNSVIAAAKANQINTLYITIDDYLNVWALPDGPDKTSKIAAYSAALEHVVSLAHQNGLAVDAEAGWRDWSEDPQRTKGFAIIDYVMEYNKEHPNATLTGFQYDVEPYLLPTYENNKATILEHYVSFIDDSAARLGNNPIHFSVVLPHFYDSVQNWTPPFVYNGVNAYAFDHILTIMDKRPASTIIVMAYRNFAVGTNGSIQISQTEVTEASTGTHTTKIIVAQETGNVTPAYVTFYSMSKAYYLQEINIIRNAFANDSGFGGMAVHYIDTFEALK